jgi:hypothetical protein
LTSLRSLRLERAKRAGVMRFVSSDLSPAPFSR